MKALPKDTPVRVVIPDVVGEVLKTETNGDDFGYRVGFGAKKIVDGKDGPVEVFEHERFFPLHEVEAIGPCTGASISIANQKGPNLDAAINEATDNALLRDALKYLAGALPGTHVSLSVSIPTTGAQRSFSISGSSWTVEEKGSK